VQVDSLPTGSVDPHRWIAVLRKEQVAMVSGDDRFADADAGKTLKATCQVLHNPVHDPPSFPREVTETALAHVIGDKAEQAYRRGDALEKRRKLMDAWASYCEPKTSGNVVPIRKKQV
jgi:hypothetical protein